MDSPVRDNITCYAIAFTVRSGSNFLCDCLAENGLGFPTEYFQYPFGVANRVWYDALGVSSDDFSGYLGKLIASKSRNNVFGAKLTWDHKNALLEEVQKLSPNASDLRTIFPNLKWIHLDRRDKIGQALSLGRAIQSGQWTSAEETQPVEIRYDFLRLLSLLQTILAEGFMWQHFFSAHDIPVLRIAYEDFVARPRETLLDIHRFIDPATAPQDAETVKVSTQFQKQHDPRSAELRRQFVDDLYHIGAAGHWADRARQLEIWSNFFNQTQWNR